MHQDGTFEEKTICQTHAKEVQKSRFKEWKAMKGVACEMFWTVVHDYNYVTAVEFVSLDALRSMIDEGSRRALEGARRF